MSDESKEAFFLRQLANIPNVIIRLSGNGNIKSVEIENEFVWYGEYFNIEEAIQESAFLLTLRHLQNQAEKER